MDNCNNCSACKPRQYIGPRFVPILSDPVEWENDRTYEQLVIVTYKGASYTSRKPVPPTVGNPADNPEYWALTGNYNAQVEEYRQLVENYKEKMDDLELRQGKNGLFAGDLAIAIGDSFGVESGNWVDVLKEISGADIRNFCEGGATFNDRGSNYPRFIQEITKANNDNSIDNDYVTKILVFAGANDWTGSYQNIISAMHEFFEYCYTNFKNAIIYVGFIGNTHIHVVSELYNTRTVALPAYQDGCVGYKNVVYVSGLENIFPNNYTLIKADGLHPNSQGYMAIATKIYSAMNGTNSELSSYPRTIKATIEGGDGEISFAITPVPYGKHIRLTSGSTINIPSGTINDRQIILKFDSENMTKLKEVLAMPLIFATDIPLLIKIDDKWENVNAQLNLEPLNNDPNNVQFRISTYNNDGTNYKNYTQATGIIFWGFSFFIPHIFS